MAENSQQTRREALAIIGAMVAVGSLVPRIREPLVPQPKPGVELDAQSYWQHHEWFIMDVAQAYETQFWDAPEWANDYELIDGTWYWI